MAINFCVTKCSFFGLASEQQVRLGRLILVKLSPKYPQFAIRDSLLWGPSFIFSSTITLKCH